MKGFKHSSDGRPATSATQAALTARNLLVGSQKETYSFGHDVRCRARNIEMTTVSGFRDSWTLRCGPNSIRKLAKRSGVFDSDAQERVAAIHPRMSSVFDQTREV